MEEEVFTAAAPSNIAFVKYWGRRDDLINLPHNSSISMSLDENVSTRTSVMISDKLDADTLFLNGKEEDLLSTTNEKLRFVKNTLEYMHEKYKIGGKILVVSENNFPSNSGLASSAAGGAALIFALNGALSLNLSNKEMSILARKISGSACRSLYGGIVLWHRGSLNDGSDSFSEQFVDEKYWPQLVDIVAIVDPQKKKVSSSEGHTLTPKTSPLYSARPQVAEANVEKIKKAILARDFQSLAPVIMKDSNEMHAIMLDSWPPILYLNDASKEIIYGINELNDKKGRYVAAYTFDAGPNAHVITTKEHADEVKDMLKGLGCVRSFIVSAVGQSPKMLGKSQSLIDIDNLAPKKKA